MADDEEKYAQRKAPQKPGAAKRPRKPRPVAVVLCNGNCELHGCEQGCAGCQACVNACRKGAVSLNERGVAHVDQDACVGCGLCAKACPQDVIHMVDPSFNITARCSNTERGPVARKVCELSCIACGACERACPAGAIHVVDNHAVIDYSACIACGMCAAKCPRGVIRDAWGIVAQN